MVATSLPVADHDEAAPSGWSMFWWRFRHNQKAMIGGSIVLVLIVCAIFAPLIAPMDPNDGELSASLAAVGEKGYPLGT
ncbi:MAG: hypothetical protein KC432_08110, partial [Thermomicrobiales bacterium]|nr:hypothetical protein [Thermomicrobiales bacterium]